MSAFNERHFKTLVYFADLPYLNTLLDNALEAGYEINHDSHAGMATASIDGTVYLRALAIKPDRWLIRADPKAFSPEETVA